jgi:ornithine cyclodeaminase
MSVYDSAESMRVLTRGDVRACLSGIDPVAAIEDALRMHSAGATDLPSEAYMRWENSQGSYCRSLGMPGALGSGADLVIGMKVINAAVSNPQAGIPRAGGFTTLFENETGRPRLLAEGALISALRTAAYTMASLRHVGPLDFESVAFIGCGNLALVHADLLRRYFPRVRHLDLYDVRAEPVAALRRAWTAGGGTVAVHTTAERAAGAAPVLVTLTTSADPYIERSWLKSGTFVAHVSLDDLRADVFTGARAIYVDDRTLVVENPRRILGALLSAETGRLRVTGTLGEVLSGMAEAIRPGDGIVISNPFGMSILDIALMGHVSEIAKKTGLGVGIDLTVETPASAGWRG